MRWRGLEPPRPIGPQGPQPCASTNSATSARAGRIVATSYPRSTHGSTKTSSIRHEPAVSLGTNVNCTLFVPSGALSVESSTGEGCHELPELIVPPSRIPRIPSRLRKTTLTRSRDELEPEFTTKNRNVGRVRFTQNGGVMATLPAGIESEWESPLPAMWKLSLPVTTAAPPASVQPEAPLSNEPPCMSE